MHGTKATVPALTCMGIPGMHAARCLRRARAAEPGETTKVLLVKDARQEFVFTEVPEQPVPSLLRNFSAPVKLQVGTWHDAHSVLLLFLSLNTVLLVFGVLHVNPSCNPPCTTPEPSVSSPPGGGAVRRGPGLPAGQRQGPLLRLGGGPAPAARPAHYPVHCRHRVQGGSCLEFASDICLATLLHERAFGA